MTDGCFPVEEHFLMARSPHFVFITAFVLVLWSCATNQRTDREGVPSQPSQVQNFEKMDDHYEIPPSRDTVPAVMQAKLGHAQAILEAIAMADFAQAETNAMALKRISEGGD